jgi:hypothetical protein
MKSLFYLSFQVHAVQESSEKCGTLLPARIRRTLSPALFRRTLSPTLFESHPASEKGDRPFRLPFTKDEEEKMECLNHHRWLRSFSMGLF